MSLMPPTTCQEGVMQYCGYGYDRNLYSSYDDCINKKMKDCPPTTSTNSGYNSPNTEVTCSDGTKDVANGDILPCQGHGGVKTDAPPVKPLLTQTQKKWLAVIGITALAYVILYKAGSLD